ncbi:hypothetical protein ACKKBF_B21435 [Auxenochlorella protothecoides x Auxenochlorella symbiontica]
MPTSLLRPLRLLSRPFTAACKSMRTDGLRATSRPHRPANSSRLPESVLRRPGNPALPPTDPRAGRAIAGTCLRSRSGPHQTAAAALPGRQPGCEPRQAPMSCAGRPARGPSPLSRIPPRPHGGHATPLPALPAAGPRPGAAPGPGAASRPFPPPSPTGRRLELGAAGSEVMQSNTAGLQLLTLSRGAAAPPMAMVARMQQETWLLGCGEDAQRGVMTQPCVHTAKVDRVLVPSLGGESVLGLPGMLCTISSGRQHGHEWSDFPVHVYGPPGTLEFLDTMLAVSRTYLQMPVLVHELVPGPIARPEPTLVNARARLYGVSVPPDLCNPRGYSDAEMTALLQRTAVVGSQAKRDERSGCLPLPLPPPGDPSAVVGQLSDLQWTIRASAEAAIVARAAQAAPHQRLSFLIHEADKTGHLDVEKALALGVARGPGFGELKAGRAVRTAAGTTVTPDQVLGASLRGRRVLILDDAALEGPGRGLLPVLRGSAGEEDPPEPCDVMVASLRGLGAGGRALQDAARAVAATARLARAEEVIVWPRDAGTAAALVGDEGGRVFLRAISAASGLPVCLAGAHDLHDIQRKPRTR